MISWNDFRVKDERLREIRREAERGWPILRAMQASEEPERSRPVRRGLARQALALLALIGLR